MGKVGSYTIKEAQLIGRGARYCPFVVDDEKLKFKRKFDGDISNPNPILETMYFHNWLYILLKPESDLNLIFCYL